MKRCWPTRGLKRRKKKKTIRMRIFILLKGELYLSYIYARSLHESPPHHHRRCQELLLRGPAPPESRYSETIHEMNTVTYIAIAED
jgi:hypothetical protein